MNQNINSFVWHKIHMLAFDTETEEEKEGMMKIFNTIIQNNPTISDDLKFKHLNNDKEDKVLWKYICKNNNISVEFFDTHFHKINQISYNLLHQNNFKKWIKNEKFKIQKVESMKSICDKINNFVNLVPPKTFSPLPDGGVGYRELIQKYSNNIF